MSTITETPASIYVQQGPGRGRLVEAHTEYNALCDRARTVCFTLGDGNLLVGQVIGLDLDTAFNDEHVAQDMRGHHFIVDLLTPDDLLYTLEYNAHNRSGRIVAVEFFFALDTE